MFQPLKYHCGPLLDLLQYLHMWHVSQCLSCPGKARTGHSILCATQWCWVEGKDHIPQAADSTPPNGAEESVNFLCHKGTVLAHVQLAVHRDPQGLCKASFQLVSLQHTMVCKITPPQMQDTTCTFVKLEDVPCQLISPACSGPSEWQYNHLVYQWILPVFYHQQACLGCTLSHHPGH